MYACVFTVWIGASSFIGIWEICFYLFFRWKKLAFIYVVINFSRFKPLSAWNIVSVKNCQNLNIWAEKKDLESWTGRILVTRQIFLADSLIGVGIQFLQIHLLYVYSAPVETSSSFALLWNFHEFKNSSQDNDKISNSNFTKYLVFRCFWLVCLVTPCVQRTRPPDLDCAIWYYSKMPLSVARRALIFHRASTTLSTRKYCKKS